MDLSFLQSKCKIGDFYFSSIMMTSVAQQAIEDLYFLVEEREAKIKVDCLPTVKGNHFLLRTLFTHLLTNAIHYSFPDQRPHIEICSTEILGKSLIMVKDQGVGIKDDVIDQVLTPRKHLPDTGLYTCLRIMKFHQGNMSFNKNDPNGTIVGLIF